jgi:hypothetical protein
MVFGSQYNMQAIVQAYITQAIVQAYNMIDGVGISSVLV